MTTIDWIGSIGVFQILLAYVLNVAGRTKPTELPFILLNTLGAGMACIASILLNYVPFIVLEGAWTLVSVLSLYRYLKGKR